MSEFLKWLDNNYFENTLIFNTDDMESAYQAGIKAAIEMVREEGTRETPYGTGINGLALEIIERLEKLK